MNNVEAIFWLALALETSAAIAAAALAAIKTLLANAKRFFDICRFLQFSQPLIKQLSLIFENGGSILS
jgi:hypothetical protein